MTAYHGGKQRIGKKLSEIIYDKSMEICDDENFKIVGYCEPFCGMLGVYQYIPELFREYEEEENVKMKYRGGDINKSVIKMWNYAQKGWKPPVSTSKKEYERLKIQKKSSALKGFIGHAYSYGGIYFASYRGDYLNINNGDENKQSRNNVIKLSKELKNVKFSHGDYTQFSKLKGYVIYCDPPYSKYNRYYDEENNKLDFDNDEFLDWCEYMSRYNIVFISEYDNKRRYINVYNKNITSNYNTSKTQNNEKLLLVP